MPQVLGTGETTAPWAVEQLGLGTAQIRVKGEAVETGAEEPGQFHRRSVQGVLQEQIRGSLSRTLSESTAGLETHPCRFACD